MIKKSIIPISVPVTGEEEWQALREPIFSGWLTQGPKVAEFEKAFAGRFGVRNAVAVTSCTTALHVILKALDVGPGDEVIVPAFTWAATANVVVHCGATPIFADVDPRTFNIDSASVISKITARTKAVIPVHLFGLCADIEALGRAADRLPLIEDAACAVGAAVGNRPAGTLGIAAAFSFHPRKIITTGEGGMVTTNDKALAHRIVVLRNHGASVSEETRHHAPRPHVLPDFEEFGFNYRMTDLQGAVGLVQLAKLDGFLAERRRWAEIYNQELATIPWLKTPHVPSGYQHGWQSYVLTVDPAHAPFKAVEIMDRLAAEGIASRPGTHAVHALSVYRKTFGLKPSDCPVSFSLAQNTLSLPIHNRLTEDDVRFVARILRGL